MNKGRINTDHCGFCDRQCTPEGHDACLGILMPNIIMNACCGHGDDDAAYIQFDHENYKEEPNKNRIFGKAAREIQESLKDKGKTKLEYKVSLMSRDDLESNYVELQNEAWSLAEEVKTKTGVLKILNDKLKEMRGE